MTTRSASGLTTLMSVLAERCRSLASDLTSGDHARVARAVELLVVFLPALADHLDRNAEFVDDMSNLLRKNAI